MRRYHIIFKGRVQGVGFRYQVKALADRIGLTGTVRNLYDQSVEAYLQGEENMIIQFFKGLDKINFARIDDKTIEEMAILEDENDFQIVY